MIDLCRWFGFHQWQPKHYEDPRKKVVYYPWGMYVCKCGAERQRIFDELS